MRTRRHMQLTRRATALATSGFLVSGTLLLPPAASAEGPGRGGSVKHSSRARSSRPNGARFLERETASSSPMDVRT